MADTVAGTTATSATLASGTSVVVTIDGNGDHDWYRVNLTAGRQYVFSTSSLDGSIVDTIVQVRDATGVALAGGYGDDSGTSLFAKVGIVAPQTGVAYVDLSTYDFADVGSFRLTMTESAPTDTIGGTSATASTLGLNTPVSSRIDVNGDADWFKITLGIAQSIVIRTLPTGGSDDAEIVYGITGPQSATTYLDYTYTAYSSIYSEIKFTATSAGTYTIQLESYDGIGAYTLVAASAGSAQPNRDFNGDGRSDILWRNADGRLTEWISTSSGGFIGNSASNATVSTDWKIAGRGDFNGDGRADIVWRNDNGALTDWYGSAQGGFIPNASANGSVGTDWKIVGAGDFNGDGRSDILWRNDNGALTDWLATASNGFTGNAAANGSVGTDWKVAGTGDFNGDGRWDILWRNDNGQLTDWLANAAGGFAGNAAANGSVGTDWQIAGTGDFNGDGRTDILWRNSNGQLTNWLANAAGGFTGNAAGNASVGTDWQIVAVGDYNGDGIDDILWRNASGALTDWLADEMGAFRGNAAANNSVSSDWLVFG